MPIFTSYDPVSWEITKTELAGSYDEAHANAGAGHETVEGDFYSPQTWFPGGVATPKQTMAPTVSGQVISGLPNPCTVLVNGVIPHVVTQGTFTFPDGARVAAIIKAPGFKDYMIVL